MRMNIVGFFALAIPKIVVFASNNIGRQWINICIDPKSLQLGVLDEASTLLFILDHALGMPFAYFIWHFTYKRRIPMYESQSIFKACGGSWSLVQDVKRWEGGFRF